MAIEFKDYYKTLGVSRDADEKAIKAAYRKLARKHHPDVAKGKDAAPERFRAITEAYEVLSDPEKRRRYDTLGPDWQRYSEPQPGQGFRVQHDGEEDFSDFFRSVFGDLGARGGRGATFGAEDLFGRGGQRRRRGQDVQAGVDITLEEARAGARKTLTLEMEEPCTACDGAGHTGGQACATCGGQGWQRGRRQIDVKIPAGVRSGQRVRITGEGGNAPGGRGDLYLLVMIAPHPQFERKGDDILLDLPVTAPEAALGTTVEVPTLRGKVSMKIPAGTSSGRTFRLPGYGMPRPKGAGAGDELVKIRIVMPANLTGEERELYEKLKTLRVDSPRAYI